MISSTLALNVITLIKNNVHFLRIYIQNINITHIAQKSEIVNDTTEKKVYFYTQSTFDLSNYQRERISKVELLDNNNNSLLYLNTDKEIETNEVEIKMMIYMIYDY